MMLFLDTTALVARYAASPDPQSQAQSKAIRRLLHKEQGEGVAIARSTKVALGAFLGDLLKHGATKASVLAIGEHILKDVSAFLLVDTDPLTDTALRLAVAHRLSAEASIQLAAAGSLQERLWLNVPRLHATPIVRLVTFDPDLLLAAKASGLLTGP